MKLFECQHCGQPLYFENTRCESCGLRLGYLPAKQTITRAGGGRAAAWRALADPRRPLPLLRQRPARGLQLAGPRRQPGAVLRGLPPQPHHSRPVACPRISRTGARSKSPSIGCSTRCCKLRLPLDDQAETIPRTGWRSTSSAPPHAPHSRAGDDRPPERPHHAQSGRGRRFRARAPAAADGRAVSHAARSFPPRDRALLLGPAGREFAEPRGVPAACSATSGRTTARRCKQHYANGAAAGLAGAFRHRLCQRASLGGFRRDLGALFPHGRHAGDRATPSGCACGRKRRKGADLSTAIDFDPHSADHGPHHRCLAAADLRGQFDQPQHGHRRIFIRSCWRRR